MTIVIWRKLNDFDLGGACYYSHSNPKKDLIFLMVISMCIKGVFGLYYSVDFIVK